MRDLTRRGAIPLLRRFYYEIAQAHHAGALDALLRPVPMSQVLFGTDYPFRQGGRGGYGPLEIPVQRQGPPRHRPRQRAAAGSEV
jgi:hypothetical protein